MRNPFTGSWEDAEFAVDTSGADEGEVTRFNRPFGSWYYNIDMTGLAGEGDYTFEFRAFDGIDHSPVVSRTIKLNTQPPSIFVTTPSSFSSHDEGSVVFDGYSQDPYGCPDNCNTDIGLVYMQISGPNYQVTSPVETNSDGTWDWEWDFSTRPRELTTYTFTIWASDSDFCNGELDECQPVVLTLTIDNRNSQPTISINQPISGTRISTSLDTSLTGVARDFDGGVTRVDLEVIDVANDFVTVYEASTSEFSEDGIWEIEWDTTQLRHDAEYLLKFRSYDGIDYSDWDDVTIVVDNPPNVNNNQPKFDSSGWQSEIILYCDSESNSVDKCTTVEIDLKEYFSDADSTEWQSDIQFYSVYNDTSIQSDDRHALVVGVGSDGIARYDPADMLFFDDDMESWTLNDVIFIATDSWDSRANSYPVSFRVVPLQFTIQEPEQSWVEVDEMAIYSGIGLPGKQVSVLIGGNPVNTTLVSEDGSWELGIPASRIKGDSSIPKFTYAGTETEVSAISKGEPTPESTNWGLIGVVSVLAILSLAALAYFTGFIGIEIEEDDEYKTPAQIPKDYGDEEEESALERYDDHPGWLWDAASEEWVPDPDFQE